MHAIGRPRQAHMQVVQPMKQCFDWHWGTAWRSVGLGDPYTARRTGATDLELEAALGEIKVEEDLRRRYRRVRQPPVAQNDDGQEDNHGHRGPRAIAKAKT